MQTCKHGTCLLNRNAVSERNLVAECKPQIIRPLVVLGQGGCLKTWLDATNGLSKAVLPPVGSKVYCLNQQGQKITS